MSESSKDELIEAQKQVIGILFEIVKRLQANHDLDDEYFELVSEESKRGSSQNRLDAILTERKENSKIVGRLLEQLET